MVVAGARRGNPPNPSSFNSSLQKLPRKLTHDFFRACAHRYLWRDIASNEDTPGRSSGQPNLSTRVLWPFCCGFIRLGQPQAFHFFQSQYKPSSCSLLAFTHPLSSCTKLLSVVKKKPRLTRAGLVPTISRTKGWSPASFGPRPPAAHLILGRAKAVAAPTTKPLGLGPCAPRPVTERTGRSVVLLLSASAKPQLRSQGILRSTRYQAQPVQVPNGAGPVPGCVSKSLPLLR